LLKLQIFIGNLTNVSYIKRLQHNLMLSHVSENYDTLHHGYLP